MRNSEKPTYTEMYMLLVDQPFSVSLDNVRNQRTFSRRFEKEGLSFCTKTLPLLGKALDRALSGKVAFECPPNFKKLGGTCFPHFLGSALRVIFDETGFLLMNPCYLTVAWLRSFCYYAYKIEIPFNACQIQKFEEKFIECDVAIGDYPFVGDDSTVSLRNIMREQLLELDRVRPSTPAFGPGVSSNCRRTEKWNEFVPPSRLRNEFGRSFFHLDREHSYEYFVIFVCCFLFAFSSVSKWNPFGTLSPSKILFVNKDSRGPRTICCEDSRLMYAQKSLQKSLYSYIETQSDYAGQVNFTDQTINQKLTFDKENSTLDLKDASDRISLDLVIDVFPQKLLNYMLACRSPYYELPNGEVRVMEKFAPMGSALCFPVMALIAYTAITSAIYLAGGSVPNRNKTVFVYGDDIVVPNEWYHVAVSALTSVGLIVNENKSFHNSRFLESCGQDTLDQSDVKPIRKKKLFIDLESIRHKGRRALRDKDNALQHYVELYNHSRRAGYHNLANSLESYINQFVRLPYGTSDSPYLCKHVDSVSVFPYNRAEKFEVKGKLRAYRVKDIDVVLNYKDPYSRLRRGLIDINGIQPVNLDKLGTRMTVLQLDKFTPWSDSYR